MNRAVQYLRRLSQDPPEHTQIIIPYKQHLEFVSACVLLLVIYCCNKASNRIVTRLKDLVFYSWIPLSPEVSRLSPYTHAQQHMRTSRTFYTFAVHGPALIIPQMDICTPSGGMPTGREVPEEVHRARTFFS